MDGTSPLQRSTRDVPDETNISIWRNDAPRWDIFCRVVDNFGDIGVCWRLARQLADEHAVAVRLWVDDLSTFARLCPSVSVTDLFQRVDSIEIAHWLDDFPRAKPTDVVIEAFACEIPETYVAAMAARPRPPTWINLEYLTAEEWVDDCHKMPSRHPRWPLTKHFFFPGFTARTGGLIREKNFPPSSASEKSGEEKSGETDHDWFRARLGIERGPLPAAGLTISLFCYDNSALPELLDTWSQGETPIQLLVTPGFAHKQVSQWFGDHLTHENPLRKGALTANAIPFLSQQDYDRLLRICDLNFVRGEDSFVRAQWAGKPFVWQIYPQTEDVHLTKLDAFLSRYLANFPASEAIREFWSTWNGGKSIGTAWTTWLPSREMLEEHAKEWVGQLDQVGNLADNLMQFVREL